MINDVHTNNGKSIAAVLQDFKAEFSTFIATRIQMLQEEMKQKSTAFKAAIPSIVIGVVFLLTAWFALTGGIIAVVAIALAANPWAVPIAFGAVTVLYGLIGLILALMGKKALSKASLKPEKTIRVLQDDKAWLQTEATRLQA
jgi:protein-S-isoprenylcysteine O-methyltransferase Ste14